MSKITLPIIITSLLLLGLAFTGLQTDEEPKLAKASDSSLLNVEILNVESLTNNQSKPEVKDSPKAPPIISQSGAEAVAKATTPKSKYLDKWFSNRTGQTHWDICNSNAVGQKFVKAFEEFGKDAQVIACVTLNYENGIVGGVYRTDAVSPCWSTNTQQAVARKCTYASDNSHGVDAGLFMINTFFQAKRITKLGGPGFACSFVDSKKASDPCNVKKIAWLHNIDNQILIIKDIYREQGFQPWVAYIKHVKPFV